MPENHLPSLKYVGWVGLSLGGPCWVEFGWVGLPVIGLRYVKLGGVILGLFNLVLV